MDSSVYDDIGVRRVINASGSMTYIGGSLMAPEVLEKMNQAAGAFVFIEELLAWASGEIAALTGTESGLVTTGTAGGILLCGCSCHAPCRISSGGRSEDQSPDGVHGRGVRTGD